MDEQLVRDDPLPGGRGPEHGRAGEAPALGTGPVRVLDADDVRRAVRAHPAVADVGVGVLVAERDRALESHAGVDHRGAVLVAAQRPRDLDDRDRAGGRVDLHLRLDAIEPARRIRPPFDVHARDRRADVGRGAIDGHRVDPVPQRPTYA